MVSTGNLPVGTTRDPSTPALRACAQDDKQHNVSRETFSLTWGFVLMNAKNVKAKALREPSVDVTYTARLLHVDGKGRAHAYDYCGTTARACSAAAC